MSGKTWQPTSATQLPLGGRTDDIWFLNKDTGWAVNSNGEILATIDGGKNWTKQHQFPPRTWLRCVSFANRDRGWVGSVTRSDRLYSTSDGKKWQRVTSIPAEPTAICGLWAVDANVVYAAGTNWPNRPTAVIKTMDGGSTWQLFEMASHASLLVDIYFKDERSGWVVGGAGGSTRDQVTPVVLFTTDGGKTWVNQLEGQGINFPKGEWGWKIQFLDDQTGFVSLENFSDAAILKTTDGGRTWVRKPVLDPQRNVNLEGIGFINTDIGWVGGWGGDPLPGPGYSSVTRDGGETWEDANDIGKYINRFRFIGSPPTVAYASGSTVYKYDEHPERMVASEFEMREARFSRALVRNRDEEVVDGQLRLVVHIAQGSQQLEVNVWDSFGEHVATLFQEAEPAQGTRNLDLSLLDAAGSQLPPGQFVYRVSLDDSAESRIFINRPGGAMRFDRFASISGQSQDKPPLPTVEEEKEAFFKLANIEAYPDFLPAAKRLAYTYLSHVDYAAASLYNEFTYTEEAFDQRMRAIYDAVLPDMHQPHPNDLDVMRWRNGKSYEVGKASDRVVKDRLLQLAPFNLMDGVWLQRIMQARPSDEVQSRLFDIWADEVGNGENRQNHSNVYLDLLRSQGIYVPPVTSREFLQLELAPGAWRAPVFQMCIGVFPEEFFPELVGMTLFLEWEATPTLQPAVQMLRRRGMNPLFYSLHVAIDNISEGHGALAKEAIKIFLDEKREQGGERAVQENWKRIWNGYVGWATAGFNGEGMAERRLLIDRKSINIGTPETPICYPDFKNYYKARMITLIQRKAPFAAQVHGRKTLGGILLNDLFQDPERLIRLLLSEGWVDVANPRRSRFFRLTEYEGPMYRVFSEADQEIVLDWLDSLRADEGGCIEPLPDAGTPSNWPERMKKLVQDFSAIATRAHDQLSLPDATGAPVAMLDLFGNPIELMRALVRGGWVIPGAPDRSMFYTEILGGGGPMSGVLGQEGQSIVYNWILDGAAVPAGTTPTSATAPSETVTAGPALGSGPETREAMEFRVRRPFIGQGSVH